MKKIFLLAVAALALTACDSNDNPSYSSGAAKITATIGESQLSRASGTEWDAGDEIGISSTVGEVDGPYTNIKYTTASGNGEFDGMPLYFYKPMTLTAYYPFAGSQDTDPGLIEANTDIDNQKTDTQKKIDFLWDSKTNQDKKDFSATDNVVNFTFSHKMSKLSFAFVGSEAVYENGVLLASEAKVSDIVAYEIEGLVLDGTFNTRTGVCAIKDDIESKVLKIDLEKGFVKEKAFLSPLIVFPQKPGNDSVKLHVYTKELVNESVLQHYSCTLSFGDGELKPGNSYKYTIQISKVGLKLGEIKIDNWNTEREVNLTATIDGGVTN